MLLFTQISSTCFHIFQALIFSFHVEPQGYIFQFGEHIDDWSWCLWHAPKIGGWSCGGWGDTWVGAAVLVLLQWRNRIEVWNKTPDGLMYVQYIHAWIFHHIPSYSINFILFTRLQVSWSQCDFPNLGTHRLSVTFHSGAGRMVESCDGRQRCVRCLWRPLTGERVFEHPKMCFCWGVWFMFHES